MCSKSFFASCSLLLCAVAAVGQSPSRPAARAGKASTLVDQRMQFVCDAYEMDDQQKQRLRADLVKLQGIHDAYMSRYKRTLRRQAKAISLVIPNQKDEYDAAMRASLTAKIQDEIYRIHAKAPLSMANVISKAEAMLSPGRIESGRRKITAKYATLLKGKPLNIKTIDRLVLKPVAPSATPTAPAFAQPVATAKKKVEPVQRRRVVPEPIKVEGRPNAARPRSNIPQPGKSKPRPAVAAAASRPIGPLPPAPQTADWAATLESAAAKYGFSANQKLVAQAALKSCLKRAESYLEKNKESLDRARQGAPSGENTKKLAELRRPVDKLFNELNRRIDSIATVEQVLAAKKKGQKSSAKK